MVGFFKPPPGEAGRGRGQVGYGQSARCLLGILLTSYAPKYTFAYRLHFVIMSFIYH